MNLFQRAAAGLALTPAERALLKLLQSLLLTAILTGLLAASQYLAGNSTINWHTLLFVIGGQILLAVATAIAKYITAQGDAPIGMAVEVLTEEVRKKLGLPPLQGADNDGAESANTPPSGS